MLTGHLQIQLSEHRLRVHDLVSRSILWSKPICDIGMDDLTTEFADSNPYRAKSHAQYVNKPSILHTIPIHRRRLF